MSSSSGLRVVTLNNVLAVLVALSAGAWYVNRLSSFRPPEPAEQKPPATAGYVRARLWEDPLAAVRGQESGQGGGASADSRRASEDHITAATEAGKNIVVMPVMIPGRSYASDIEARIRARYAVSAALAQKGFVPKEWDRIRYLALGESPPQDDNARSSDPRLLVPYEWFFSDQADESNCSRVLVLWLDDTKFDQKPLASLFRVLEKISPAPVCQPSLAVQQRLELPVRLIGPTSSDTLRQMLVEISDPGFMSPADLDFSIYSPWATADWQYLWAQEGATSTCPEALCLNIPGSPTRIWRKGYSKCGDEPSSSDIVLERTIASDGEIIRELAFELKARGVDVCDDGSVLLISEWDTLYGQVFQRTFRHQLVSTGICKEAETKKVPRAVYLAGIDGKLPGETGESSSAQETAGKKNPTAAEEIERPGGRSQIDYLRRMADELARGGSKKVRAIGVIGNDVFDKLLILQALRDRLPDVIFFTTDIDASFLHPSQRRWTRNLLVAASYGLEAQVPGTRSGDRVPPFRDTYQTAMYAACQLALAPDRAICGDDLNELKKTKVFEIGRTRIIPLPSAESDAEESTAGWWIGIVAGTAVLLCLAAVAWRRLRNRYPPASGGCHVWLAWRWFAVLLLVVSLIVVEISFYYLQSVAEPFVWFEGVSVWPSVLLRSAAAVLAAILLAWIPQWLRQDSARLGKLFGPKDPPAVAHAPWWKRWVTIVDGGPQDVSSLWSAYQTASQSRDRLWRVGIPTILYVAVVLSVMLGFGHPHSPHRGMGSFCAAILPLAVGVLLQAVLTFLTVDAICLCRGMVKQLVSDDIDVALAVELIANRTRTVGLTVLAPFSVLLLFILSRVSVFDRWDWPVSLLVVYSINQAIALVCSFLLWRAVEGARQRALGRLRAKRLRLAASADSEAAHQLDLLIERVRSVNEGAFAPLSQQPLITALYLATGGIGIEPVLNLLERML